MRQNLCGRTPEELDHLVGAILEAIRGHHFPEIPPGDNVPFKHVLHEDRLFELLNHQYPNEQVVKRGLAFLEGIKALVRIKMGGRINNGYGTLDRALQHWEGKKLSDDEIAQFHFDEDRQMGSKPATVDSKKVFIVHGHDEAAKESVARFLEHLQLTPIILHEQPNKGRTIIEKFEGEAVASFAIVLLTPDDEGMKFGSSSMEPRARQNVVWEMGFFCGALGRARVCALVKGAVQKPSDIDGVVYVEMDTAGAWKTQLAKEMKVAGLQFDFNLVLGR